MRVRRVIRRGTRKTVGKFPTLKQDLRLVHWESLLERDFYYLLEIDPNVICFKEQPLRIEYMLDGKFHYYTPDLLVERIHKKQIVEVKPTSKVRKYDQIFRMASQVCERNGYEFIVVTDDVIREQPRLYNVKLLWRYSRIPIEPIHQILCHEFFIDKRDAKLIEVIDFFEIKGIYRQIVYGLLYWGILEIDVIKRRIGPDSNVRLPITVRTAGNS